MRIPSSWETECIAEESKLAADKIVQRDPGKQCSANLQTWTVWTDNIPEASRPDQLRTWNKQTQQRSQGSSINSQIHDKAWDLSVFEGT